jgi:hypothetical protein
MFVNAANWYLNGLFQGRGPTNYSYLGGLYILNPIQNNYINKSSAASQTRCEF